MKYNKYEVGPYNLHIIKTDKFKSVSFTINFKRPLKKEEITYRSFMEGILLESTKKYTDQQSLLIKAEELYDLRTDSTVTNSGNYSVISFMCQILNEKYSEAGMLNKSVKFLLDMIFEPNVINNTFNQESFDIVRRNLTQRINSIYEKPSTYAYYQMLKEMDKDALYSYRTAGYMEDLEKITPQNLYEYYKGMLHSDLVDIFIIGDVKDSQIKKIFSEKFNIRTLKKPGIAHTIEHEKARKRIKTKVEKSEFLQSKLVIGAKILKSSEFEQNYVAHIFNDIFGGGSDSKLFKMVREKHSLCYSIRSELTPSYNLMTITAGIDKKDFKLAVDLIKKEFSNMKNGNFSEEEVEIAKKYIIDSRNKSMDSPFSMIARYTGIEYFKRPDHETYQKEIMKVNKQMVIDYAKKVYFDTIFLLEGGQNGEDHVE